MIPGISKARHTNSPMKPARSQTSTSRTHRLPSSSSDTVACSSQLTTSFQLRALEFLAASSTIALLDDIAESLSFCSSPAATPFDNTLEKLHDCAIGILPKLNLNACLCVMGSSGLHTIDKYRISMSQSVLPAEWSKKCGMGSTYRQIRLPRSHPTRPYESRLLDRKLFGIASV